MKQIINLMKLDFITVKGKSLLIFSILFAAVCVVGFFSVPILPIYLVLFSGFALQPIFSTAEHSGFNKLYGILPVKRRYIVIARFALLTIVMLITAIMGIIVCELLYEICLSQNYKGDNRQFYEIVYFMKEDGFPIPLMVSVVFCLGAILTALEFTVTFIFGTSKELPASIAAAFGVYGLLTLIIVTLQKVFDISANDVFTFFADLLANDIWVLYIMCYAIGIAAMALGALISIACTKKKEL